MSWKKVKLKYLANMRSGDSITSDSIDGKGSYPVYGGGALRGYTESYTHEGNYILIGRQGANCGSVRQVNGKFFASEHAVVVSHNSGVDNEWLYYLLESMNLNQYSISAAQPGLAVNTIKNLEVNLPSYDLQIVIRKYIDKKTKIFETIIKQKEDLIELLEEQRQSIITEAVTKGLNPNVKMKDSGIEWIGEIPEHWSILALKHIASEKKHSFVDGPFGSDLKNEEYVDSGVPVIQLNNIKNGDLRVINMNFVTKEKSEQLKRHIAYPGDLVIAKMASPIARSAVVPKTYENYVIVADCIKLKLKENYLNHYINFAMNTPFTIAQAESFANGTTRSRVNLSIIKNLKLPIPNFEEQKEIASYLTLKVSEVNNVIKAVENQIQKLKEYRQSLIYEAVTGKIDVRDMELDEVR
ncbi:restriction endonuclease subunit S [Bacillus altitudinis]|uniref:restriction endonuclease subunit S n=1 Tax=Bacillus altitudinis TaxID=293387 RepID=UPI00227E04CB|nr:restriction endonuclease subunit S [Bacillus altitudinis]MCY7628902.1 restriction endonuclease subunit S [Bacillus altitudinis]MDX2365083.1 restriction endonuclease subunit S [Bacillus altitudinis]MED0849251.1 restriction endonuclease subunit S [Bacillus altitudinis]